MDKWLAVVSLVQKIRARMIRALSVASIDMVFEFIKTILCLCDVCGGLMLDLLYELPVVFIYPVVITFC